MTRLRATLPALLLLTAPVPGQAQEVSVDQIGSSRAESIGQISAPTAKVVPAERSEPRGVATPQLSAGDEGRAPVSQLSSSGSSRNPTSQVSNAVRSADQPQPLSRPQDGRTAAVERVAGADRCDPARPDRARAANCAAVIENRAAQYSRREVPTLSPEERLLTDQQYRAGLANANETARRLAGEATGVELQGVASVVLGNSRKEPEPKRRDEPDPSAAGAGIIEAILGGGVTAPPPGN